MEADKIDRSRAIIRRNFQFKPFLTGNPLPLSTAKLNPDEDLLIFERGGGRFSFILRQMVYHHVAQGLANGIPYLVSF